MGLFERLDAYTRQKTAEAEAREQEIAASLDLVRFCDDYCRLCYAADLRVGLVAGPPTDNDPNDRCCYCDQPKETPPT